jgi:hypothetical protein
LALLQGYTTPPDAVTLDIDDTLDAVVAITGQNIK